MAKVACKLDFLGMGRCCRGAYAARIGKAVICNLNFNVCGEVLAYVWRCLVVLHPIVDGALKPIGVAPL